MPKLSTTRLERSTVADIARRAGLTYEQAVAFADAVVQELVMGREVRIQGLGVFHITTSKARKFSTPVVPGGVANVPERKVIRFRSAPTSQGKVNAAA